MRSTLPLLAIAAVSVVFGTAMVRHRQATAAPPTTKPAPICDAVTGYGPTCAVPPLNPARVKVPAGAFSMGSTGGAKDEAPVHTVKGAAFEMDRYEVTNARFAACVKAGSCAPPSLSSSKLRAHYHDDPKFADYPVIFVSWEQASSYCKFAGGRLPSEAEWERAARGTDAPRTFPWGESAPDCKKANFAGCVGDTDRVGMREAGASPYGAMDMAGNVWEWTADWYDSKYYAHSPSVDPKGPETGTLKVMRGGCWVSGADSLRTTCRKAELPKSWAPNVGFRCVYGGAS
ncbi:MAG: SUMF1/EgtB/PvdO family nonheme iron enzyme [Deltaproteobacteria bacterium]|nr:SUMF1/EgtB/PvdO family nonheme iron enzyme [Deltaproteobacteria bacterium]